MAIPIIVAGNHIYSRCPLCDKLVRLTGLFARWHFCLTDEEIARKQAAADQSPQQPYGPPVSFGYPPFARRLN